MKTFIEPETRLKSIKIIYYLIHLLMESSKIFVFRFCSKHVIYIFFYNAVNI